jgi:hypothetical protein
VHHEAELKRYELNGEQLMSNLAKQIASGNLALEEAMTSLGQKENLAHYPLDWVSRVAW